MAFPVKTINDIIPCAPGGESDISARLQEPAFEKLTRQTKAIQYKPGAGGALGKGHRPATLSGSSARRAGVAAVMPAWAFALPVAGFLLSSAVAMAAAGGPA